MSTKLTLILWLLKAVLGILQDSDGDGRPDVLDSDPNDPNVK